jgi:hypothetical protein
LAFDSASAFAFASASALAFASASASAFALAFDQQTWQQGGYSIIATEQQEIRKHNI